MWFLNGSLACTTRFGHGVFGNDYFYEDANANRATLKWKQFVNPATPVPTGISGAAGCENGRPIWVGRYPLAPNTLTPAC